ENKIAIAEAGTGTGKTLAYLLPAIRYAVENQERMVVSTNTINLQEQLINKDLPFLKGILTTEFKAVLVKGRSNYACKRKLSEADQDLDLFSEDSQKSELKTILDWAKSTLDGSKSDLNIEPRNDTWEKIQSESDTSLKTKCPFYNECFFYAARRRAAVADILVANHHLLFSDLAVRAALGASENAILPTYDRIILDEAHNIEEVATNYFGTRVTFLGLLRMLGKLYRKKDDEEKGLLIYLSGKLTKVARHIPHEDFLKTQTAIQDQGLAAVEHIRVILTETMEKIYDVVRGLQETVSQYDEIKLRLVPEIIEDSQWQEEVISPAKELVLEMRRFTAKLNQVLSKVEAIQMKVGPAVLSLTIDLQAQLDRLDMTATRSSTFFWSRMKRMSAGLK
ncbi:MAG: ATP-dependent DNA helicase, partial [bacterium]